MGLIRQLITLATVSGRPSVWLNVRVVLRSALLLGSTAIQPWVSSSTHPSIAHGPSLAASMPSQLAGRANGPRRQRYGAGAMRVLDRLSPLLAYDG